MLDYSTDIHFPPGPRLSTPATEWRCAHCGKLLGRIIGKRLHIRFRHFHECMVPMPVTNVCGHCHTMNELPAPYEPGPAASNAA